MDATLFLSLPNWLDELLRERADKSATTRQGVVRQLLVQELGSKNR